MPEGCSNSFTNGSSGKKLSSYNLKGPQRPDRNFNEFICPQKLLLFSRWLLPWRDVLSLAPCFFHSWQLSQYGVLHKISPYLSSDSIQYRMKHTRVGLGNLCSDLIKKGWLTQSVLYLSTKKQQSPLVERMHVLTASKVSLGSPGAYSPHLSGAKPCMAIPPSCQFSWADD